MEIYSVRISDINQYALDELSLFISKDKKSIIDKFVYKQDKIRTLIGEILIRTIIMKKLNIKNENIILGKNQYGKPYLKNHPDLNFNISHSGDFVVCAIDNADIGIDIEKFKSIEFKEIVEHSFTEIESKYVFDGDIHTQLNRFYEIWTLKESYVKCCGQGLSIPLKSFSIDIATYGNIRLVYNAKYIPYSLNLLDINSGYKMAVCSLNDKIPNNMIIIEQCNLINKYLKYVQV